MAIQLRITQSTVFKQTTEQSSQVPNEDKVLVAAGKSFDVHSWKLVNQSHISIALLKDFLGDPPRNTWYAYIPDIQLIRPASLKVTQNTVFKQSTVNSSEVTAPYKVEVAAGQVFNLQSWATANNNHFKITLASGFLGDPPRNTWYVYAPHMQFINQQPQIIPIDQPLPPTGGLPSTKQLNVPHKSQLDNALNPTGACNVTSLAMVVAYFQIKGSTGVGQLEDEIYAHMEERGLVRGNPQDLSQTAYDYGLINDFTYRGSLFDIRKAIAEGRPCIIHGNFTSFGHIIVVRGFDPYGFFVNDPYGEWTSSGYRTDLSGENLHYSNALIQSKCSPEGEDYIWLHRFAKR